MRSISFSINGSIFITVEKGIFGQSENDEFIIKLVEKAEDAKSALEVGFEQVGIKDNLIFLRKRK